MGRKTTVERLWDRIDELKVLLSGNPRVSIEECRGIVKDVERDVRALRRRELRRRRTKK